MHEFYFYASMTLKKHYKSGPSKTQNTAVYSITMMANTDVAVITQISLPFDNFEAVQKDIMANLSYISWQYILHLKLR